MFLYSCMGFPPPGGDLGSRPIKMAAWATFNFLRFTTFHFNVRLPPHWRHQGVEKKEKAVGRIHLGYATEIIINLFIYYSSAYRNVTQFRHCPIIFSIFFGYFFEIPEMIGTVANWLFVMWHTRTWLTGKLEILDGHNRQLPVTALKLKKFSRNSWGNSFSFLSYGVRGIYSKSWPKVWKKVLFATSIARHARVCILIDQIRVRALKIFCVIFEKFVADLREGRLGWLQCMGIILYELEGHYITGSKH